MSSIFAKLSKGDLAIWNFYLNLGSKRYEITNHLGNVMTVINDRKTPIPLSAPFDDVAEYFMPTILMEMDYFPFGMQLFDPATLTLDGEYRFGFGGQERDDEIKGPGNSYSYTYRIYDPRLGRFLSVDPLTRSYPWFTPYQFAGNKPIWAMDLDGLEEYYITDYYKDQQLVKTVIQVIKDNSGNIRNFEARNHNAGIGYRHFKALVRSVGDLPDGVQPFAGIRDKDFESEHPNYNHMINTFEALESRAPVAGFTQNRPESFSYKQFTAEDQIQRYLYTGYYPEIETSAISKVFSQTSSVANLGFVVPMSGEITMIDRNTGTTLNLDDLAQRVAHSVGEFNSTGSVDRITIQLQGDAGSSTAQNRLNNYAKQVLVPFIQQQTGVNNVEFTLGGDSNSIMISGSQNVNTTQTNRSTTPVDQNR